MADLLAFGPDEFARRLSALRRGMDDAGVDTLFLTSPADIFYSTGFLTRFWESPARPWFVVIPSTGTPVAVIPSIGRDLMARTWGGEIRTWEAPDPVDDGVSLLTETLAGVVPQGGTIGLPMGLETSLRMPLADFRRVEAALAPRRFVDATAVVQRVREVKSAAEIDRIREACRVAGLAFDTVAGSVAADSGLAGVARRFQATLLSEGADWVSYLAGGAGPGGYGNVISPFDCEIAKAGDILMLDTGAVVGGYFCDFDRNFAVGWADVEVQRGHGILWEATEYLIDALRPGMTARDAHAVLTKRITSAGYPPPRGRLGHGVGVTLTEWPSFTDRDDTLLVENMVLAIEPSIEISPGRLLVHEENVVLRADGCELLSPRAPAELPVIVS